MKVLVCGGRNYSNLEHVLTTLDEIHKETPISMIIHGGASGADSLGGMWAVLNHVPQMVFPAKWKQYGKSAGMIRNRLMLTENPDLVVAFPGGVGTENMVRISLEAGIKVKVV